MWYIFLIEFYLTINKNKTMIFVGERGGDTTGGHYVKQNKPDSVKENYYIFLSYKKIYFKFMCMGV